MGLVKKLTGRTLKKLIARKPGDVSEFVQEAQRIGATGMVATLELVSCAVYDAINIRLSASYKVVQMVYTAEGLDGSRVEFVDRPAWYLRNDHLLSDSERFKVLKRNRETLMDRLAQGINGNRLDIQKQTRWTTWRYHTGQEPFEPLEKQGHLEAENIDPSRLKRRALACQE